MRIQELMSRPVIVCRSGDSLNEAAQLMWENDCGAVPVVNDGGQLVGMLTDRDICMAAYTQGRKLRSIPVSEVMAKRIFSCTLSDSTDAVEALMAEKRVRRLPVVDAENRPVGMIAINDLARHASTAKFRNGQRDLVHTLASICEPRLQSKPVRADRSQPNQPAALA